MFQVVCIDCVCARVCLRACVCPLLSECGFYLNHTKSNLTLPKQKGLRLLGLC